MKKGQMEIIGLFVVIILLSMAFLIALKFILEEKPSQEDARDSIRAETLMNTLFFTHSDFSESNNNKLIDEINRCIGQNNCGDVQLKIQNILDKILKNENYYLVIGDNIERPSIEIYRPSQEECNEGSLDVITVNGKIPLSFLIIYRFGFCKKI